MERDRECERKSVYLCERVYLGEREIMCERGSESMREGVEVWEKEWKYERKRVWEKEHERNSDIKRECIQINSHNTFSRTFMPHTWTMCCIECSRKFIWSRLFFPTLINVERTPNTHWYLYKAGISKIDAHMQIFIRVLDCWICFFGRILTRFMKKLRSETDSFPILIN